MKSTFKLLAMEFKAALLLICHISLCQQLGSCISMSTNFAKLENIELLCGVNLVPLLPHAGDHLTCSRACKENPDCTSFVFTPFTSSIISNVRLGTCSFCPAYKISGLNYINITSQAETWLGFLGRILDPPSDTYLPIPGALSMGKLLVIKSRVPIPEPERIIFDIFHNNKEEVTTRVSPRFNFRNVVKKLMISTKVNKMWAVTGVSLSNFPFFEGTDFEINILTTHQGFMVYAGGILVRTLYETLYMATDIGYLRFEYSDVHMIIY
ncbi:hypothetical protein ElyMa_004379300 [Elysia marginata]|uniref:Galectin n=1 Tax=Elysia marginata TaxID=1093978 RepID=A0AAV4H5V8_9GAST|nr:hypothetical protein ElyMa_004379300 [Elysia marginata]